MMQLAQTDYPVKVVRSEVIAKSVSVSQSVKNTLAEFLTDSLLCRRLSKVR